MWNLIGLRRYFVVVSLLSALSGCGTCVTVEGTDDEVWQATVRRPGQRDELQYRAEIKPVGSAQRVKYTVCVWVREVDNAIVDGVRGDETEQMQSRRRRDLETAVTGHLERALGGGEQAE